MKERYQDLGGHITGRDGHMQRGLSQPGVVRGSFFQEVAFEQRPECEIK